MCCGFHNATVNCLFRFLIEETALVTLLVCMVVFYACATNFQLLLYIDRVVCLIITSGFCIVNNALRYFVFWINTCTSAKNGVIIFSWTLDGFQFFAFINIKHTRWGATSLLYPFKFVARISAVCRCSHWAPPVLSLRRVQNSRINRQGIGLPSARNSLIHLNFYPSCRRDCCP